MSRFNYMSDNYLTTVFTEDSFTCDCCRKMSNFKYIGPQYSPATNDAILCPECIQTGEAVESGLVDFFNEIDPECVDDNVFSAQAAKEIETLIAEAVARIGSGSQLVGKAGETMKEIVNSIGNVTSILVEIAQASNEQNRGISQVGVAILQMDSVT